MNHNYEPAPRAMYKGELALAYNESLSQQQALEVLNRWINRSPGLMDRLLATGFSKHQKILTPAQVGLIYEALGTP